MLDKIALLTVRTVTLSLLMTGVVLPPAHATNALGDPIDRSSASKTGSTSFIATEEETKAGDITVGSTNQVVVKFKNDSGAAVKVGQINLYPASTVGAEVSLNECMTVKEPLAAGAECAIVISIKGLKVGNFRIEMLIRHDGKAKIVTTAITGAVVAGDEKTDSLLSDVEMIPNNLDFGSMTSSRPLVKSVVMRNVTSKDIKIEKMGIEASPQSGYELSSNCKELKAGQACMATVTWSPVTSGKSDGVLVVEHDGATRVASINISGSYDPKAVGKANIFPDAVPGAGLLVASQETIDFGKISDEASVTISLVNVGDDEMQIKDIQLGGEDKGLSIASSGCKDGSVLEPVAACALTIKWEPVREGEIVEDVRILHDGARGVLVIPVRGSSSTTINRDTEAVVVTDKSIMQDIKPVEKKQALEGFVITSHSGKKAIINGPGGSRVVSNGQNVVLGGIEWKINIIDTGIEFINSKDKVRLLFDRSLSASSRTGNGSSTTDVGGAGASGSSSSSAASTSSSSSGSSSTPSSASP